MNPDRKLDIEIFNAALEIESPAEQMRYVQEACAGNAERLQRIEALLKSYDASDSVFTHDRETKMAVSPQAAPLAEGPGTRIGPYKLLQQIGEGGMGVVYMAEQAEPVQRKVALKIIKIGMDTRQVVARFEAERQALAMMDHSNIAKVFDGGSTESGRPYFVMELVQGVPITEFCDKNKLSTQERIELFVPVCRAIQSAHHKGIIHRDIKPNNVLVTLHHGEPMPKVIDFGVAKAINQKLTEKTLFTNYAAMIGTPAYMSPEQAEMSSMDVDTRTDVYSLGVLLYELLTGTTPFDQKQLLSKGYGEMQRIIAEDEPQRPSLRASTMAAEKKTAAARSRRLEDSTLEAALRGDLDWITMKCIEKDRRRRYDTPTELIADLRRHLNNEPVGAAAPSVTYQVRKFYLRNRTMVRAATAIAVTLVLATAISAGMAIRMSHLRKEAVAAEKNARTQAAIAEAVNKFVNDDLLQQANPWNSPDADIKLRTVVDRAAKAIEGKFKEQPLVEASIRAMLGDVYRGLDDVEAARRHTDRAREIYERELGPEHRDTLKVRVGSVKDATYASDKDPSKLSDACKMADEVLALCRRVLGAEHAVTLEAMRNRIYALGRNRYKDQRAALEEAIPLHEKVLGTNDGSTISLLLKLGVNYRVLSSQFEREAELYKEAVKRTEALPVDHPNRFLAKRLLCLSKGFQSDGTTRQRMLQENLDAARRVFGPAHWMTLDALAVRALIANHEEAFPLFNEAHQLAVSRWGADDLRTLLYQMYLAQATANLGDRQKAEQLLLSGIEKVKAKIDTRSPLVTEYFWRTGQFYLIANDMAKAETFYREALNLAAQSGDGQGVDLHIAVVGLQRVYAKGKQWREAADVTKMLLQKRKEAFGIRNSRTTEQIDHFTHYLDELDQTEDADEFIAAAAKEFADSPPQSDEDWVSVRNVINAIGHSANKHRHSPVIHRVFDPPPATQTGLFQLQYLHWISGDRHGWHRAWKALSTRFPEDHSHWYNRSAAAIEIGDAEDNVIACRELLSRFGDETENASTMRHVLKACFVNPIGWSPAEVAKINRLYERLDALSATTLPVSRLYHGACLALADCRLGRFEKGLDQLTKAGIEDPIPQGTESRVAMGAAQALAVAALCHANLGKQEAAAEALRLSDNVIRDLPSCHMSPVDSCTRKYLYDEARQLIKSNGGTGTRGESL